MTHSVRSLCMEIPSKYELKLWQNCNVLFIKTIYEWFISVDPEEVNSCVVLVVANWKSRFDSFPCSRPVSNALNKNEISIKGKKCFLAFWLCSLLQSRNYLVFANSPITLYWEFRCDCHWVIAIAIEFILSISWHNFLFTGFIFLGFLFSFF